ncbi:unnamed protein product [Amoebophrya sp. A25]|nr:unnamed protein product [Amoebophrya sp. A25]|eukprot:GSA25T00001543001.1
MTIIFNGTRMWLSCISSVVCSSEFRYGKCPFESLRGTRVFFDRFRWAPNLCKPSLTQRERGARRICLCALSL